MLSVFFGTDTTRVRQKAFTFLRTLTDDDATIVQVTPERYEEGIIIDLAGGASLFGDAQVCLVDTLSDDKEIFERALEHIERMGTSANHFVIIEGALLAPQKKKIQAHATKMEEITGEKKERFNAFLLTDAFLRKDKKSLWLLLMEAWREGLSNEEIIGVLFWQVKMLRLAEKTSSAEEAGQKPFVYQKAKRALGQFKKGELDTHSSALITMYHDGHLGLSDTARSLEKWVLTL